LLSGVNVVVWEQAAFPRASTHTLVLPFPPDTPYTTTKLPSGSIATAPPEEFDVPIRNGFNSGCGEPLTPAANEAEATPLAVMTNSKLAATTSTPAAELRTRVRNGFHDEAALPAPRPGDSVAVGSDVDPIGVGNRVSSVQVDDKARRQGA
jgi:hypothetical protein